jgi:hypothetical protein
VSGSWWANPTGPSSVPTSCSARSRCCPCTHSTGSLQAPQRSRSKRHTPFREIRGRDSLCKRTSHPADARAAIVLRDAHAVARQARLARAQKRIRVEPPAAAGGLSQRRDAVGHAGVDVIRAERRRRGLGAAVGVVARAVRRPVRGRVPAVAQAERRRVGRRLAASSQKHPAGAQVSPALHPRRLKTIALQD